VYHSSKTEKKNQPQWGIIENDSLTRSGNSLQHEDFCPKYEIYPT
jgi:hypothetical protein